MLTDPPRQDAAEPADVEPSASGEQETASAATSSDAQPPSFPAATLGSREAIVALLSRILKLDDHKDSQVARIALELGLDIIEGRLGPGASVNSVEMAQRFKTSRTPVREALILLQKEGLIDMPPRRRPIVATLDPGPVREIYRVRAALAALVAELICERATDAQLAELREHLRVMEESLERGDADSYFWANVWLNERATAIAGSAPLSDLTDSLGLRVLQLRHLSMSPLPRARESYRDHARLLDAYDDRDARLAAALSQSLIMKALDALNRAAVWQQSAP